MLNHQEYIYISLASVLQEGKLLLRALRKIFWEDDL